MATVLAERWPPGCPIPNNTQPRKRREKKPQSSQDDWTDKHFVHLAPRFEKLSWGWEGNQLLWVGGRVWGVGAQLPMPQWEHRCPRRSPADGSFLSQTEQFPAFPLLQPAPGAPQQQECGICQHGLREEHGSCERGLAEMIKSV